MLAKPPKTPARLQVVRTQPQAQYTATEVLTEQVVQIANGHEVRAFPGDWLLSQGDSIIDVYTAARLRQHYQPVEENRLTLAGPDRTSLEQMLGFGSTADSATLTRAVIKLASLSIGDIEVKFSTAQWGELTLRAAKRNLPISVYMQHVVDRLLQDLWTSA